MSAIAPTPVPGSSTDTSPEIVVLRGDETGQAPLEQALRVLDPAVVRLPLQFEPFDLSLENRRLGGQSSRSDFTDEVIRRVSAKLVVWTTLG